MNHKYAQTLSSLQSGQKTSKSEPHIKKIFLYSNHFFYFTWANG